MARGKKRKRGKSPSFKRRVAAKDKDDAARVLRLARARKDMAERMGQVDVAALTDDNKKAMREIMDAGYSGGERFLQVLGIIAEIQESSDRQPTLNEVQEITGIPHHDLLKLTKMAERAGFAEHDGMRLSFRETVMQKRTEVLPEERLKRAGRESGGFKPRGALSIPTATVKHFTHIAREEGLPDALDQGWLDNLAPLARHLVVETQVLQTPEGHSYVRADMICGTRARLADAPDVGEYAGVPLVEVAKDLTKQDLPPLLEEIRGIWAKRGWIEQEPNGEWCWRQHMDEVQAELDQWELRNLTPIEVTCTLPLRQFGLLVEAGNTPVPEEDGAEMPVHGGARSFAGIWRRQTRLVEMVHTEGLSFKAYAKVAIEKHGNEPVEDEQLKPLLAPSLAWAGRAVAASGVLAKLRECTTVAVDMDVSEGLPDWETPEEAWAYADEAELPFPVTYFDFTTPGGYRPGIGVKTVTIDGEPDDVELTLRAAICWKQEGYLVIAPFVWFSDANNEPDNLNARSDYDSPGALHFGLSDGLKRQAADGREFDMEKEAMGEIVHLRITSPEGLCGPSQVVFTNPLFGLPGWVDLFADLQGERGQEDGVVLRSEALMVAAAACRVLSVIYALDGTVNIELAEGNPSRPERREVERALKKGKQAEISRTVRIHATRQDDREPKDREGKREYSHAFFRRGHFAHYPIGTRMADRMAEQAPNKLVNHPVKGLCRKIYRKPTIVGRIGADGEEREPLAKSYVWAKGAGAREKQAA